MVAEQQCVLLLSQDGASPLAPTLRLQDMDVDVVSLTVEAARCLRVKHYSVVVLDLIVVEPGSLEFLKEYRESGGPARPIVILLTAERPESLNELELDIHAILRKPADLNGLAEIVHDCTVKLAQRAELLS